MRTFPPDTGKGPRGKNRARMNRVWMKRLDLHALGWVVTRDTCVEIARRALGRPPGMSPAALRETGQRWRAIHAADRADARETFSIGRSFAPPSKQHDQAVLAFVHALQTSRPDLYSERALRKRCLGGSANIILSLTFGAILASRTSPGIPIVGGAVLALFAIASWYLVTTIQLWRAHLLVKRISEIRRSADLVTQESLAESPDRLPEA